MGRAYLNSKKISFQTVDMGVSLTALEYEYLKFICGETLRTSDDVFRTQIRNLQVSGVPEFEQWRQEYIATIDQSTAANLSQKEADKAETNGAGWAEPNPEPAPERKRRGRRKLDQPPAPEPAASEPRQGKRGRKAALDVAPAAMPEPAIIAPEKAETNGTVPIADVPADAPVEPTQRRKRRRSSVTTEIIEPDTPSLRRGRKADSSEPAAAPAADEQEALADTAAEVTPAAEEQTPPIVEVPIAELPASAPDTDADTPIDGFDAIETDSEQSDQDAEASIVTEPIRRRRGSGKASTTGRAAARRSPRATTAATRKPRTKRAAES